MPGTADPKAAPNADPIVDPIEDLTFFFTTYSIGLSSCITSIAILATHPTAPKATHDFVEAAFTTFPMIYLFLVICLTI